jgi:cytochrome P450
MAQRGSYVVTTVDLVYDPYDYAIDADPHPVWKRLRDEAPVYYNERYGFYALSRFDDVLAAHVDTATYSSAHTTVLESMTADPDPFFQTLMIFMDPPQHTRYRKMVSRAFTPRHMAAIEERIRDLAASFLDEFVGEDGFDYVADFGARLPVISISALLGAPREDEADLRRWSDDMLHIEPGEVMGARGQAIQREIRAYWQAQIDERRARSRDDIMSELIAAELEEGDGSSRPLTDDELHAFFGMLSAAGNETVARFLGWAATGLDQYPDERRALAEDTSLIPNAVEEILRWEAPSAIQGRWLTRSVELHGTTIPENSKVALLTGAANRDERAFPDPDPDRIDVRRTIPRHVAFGYGVHFCLGAALARLEGRVALEETLKRFPRWTVDRANCEMVHTSTVRGYEKVPISTR